MLSRCWYVLFVSHLPVNGLVDKRQIILAPCNLIQLQVTIALRFEHLQYMYSIVYINGEWRCIRLSYTTKMDTEHQI